MDDNVLFTLEGDSAGAVGSLEEINGALDTLDAQIGAVASSAGDLDGLEGTFAGISESVGGLDGLISGFAEALGALTAQAQSAADTLAQLNTSAGEASGSMDAVAGSADAASGSMDALAGSAETASTSLDAVAASGDKAAASAKGAADSSGGLGEQFGHMTMPLMVAGAAIAAVGGIALHMAGDFQESMTQLVTGAGESVSNLQMVSNGVLALSTKTGESTSQLAAGMFMIESAGNHGAKGLAILADAAEAAKVGGADLGATANALTTVLANYGSQGVTAAQATNTLVAIVANGKSHMQDLASSISTVLPAAAKYGVNLTDVGAALATMTAQNGNAAASTTYLRQLLTSLASPSAASTKALASIGLSAQQVSDDMKKSLPDTLQLITDRINSTFKPGSVAAATAFKNIAGGARQMQGMLLLTGQSMGTFKQNVLNISDAVKKGGNDVTGWAKVQADMNTKLAQTGAAAQVLMIHLGQQLAPAFEQVLSAVTPLLMALGNWVSGHGAQAVKIFEVLAAAVGGGLVAALAAAAAAFIAANIVAIGIIAAVTALSAGVAILVMNWGKIVSFFESFSGPAIAVKSLLIGIGAAVLAFAVAQVPALIGAAVAAIPALWGMAAGFAATAAGAIATAAPFILIGLAVAAVAVGIFLLIKHWSQVQAFFGHLGALIGQFFSGLGARVHAGVDAALAWVAHLGQQAQALVRAGFALVQTIIRNDINAIVGIFAWLFNHNYYFHNLVVGIQREFTWLHSAALAVWHAITASITAVWDFIKQTAQNDWAAVQRFIIQPVEAVYARLHAWGVQIGATLRAAWQVVTRDVQSAWNQFVSVITGTAGRAGGAARSVGDAITAPIRNLGAALFSAGQNLMHMLISGITSMAGAVGNAAKGIAQHIASFLGFHSPTEQGPGADADKWMVALGDMLAQSLHAQVNKVQQGANAIAQAVAASMQGIGAGSAVTPTIGGVGVGAAAGGAVGGAGGTIGGGAIGSGGFGLGGGGGAGMAQFAQLIAQAISRQAPLGAQVTPASLGSVTQNLGGVNISGVQDVATLYQQLNQLAGLAIENGGRGATAGLGL